MPWREWNDLRQAGQAAEFEEHREQYIVGAFVAWQIGAGGGKHFDEYLRAMGLSDKRQGKGSKAAAMSALAEANRIVELDRRQRSSNDGADSI